MLVKPLVRPIVRAIAGNPTASLGSGFSPTSLFLDGSKGVLYDNNDLSSFYLDSAGTTAATVNGLVGLQLDKSANLALGAELFDAPSSTESAGVVQQGTSNDYFLTAAAASTGAIAYNAGMTARAGKWFAITYEIYDYVSGSVAARVQGLDKTTRSSNGIFTEYHLAAGVADFVGVSTISTSTLKIRNYSVKELPGNHRYQTTTGSKPVLRGTPTGANLVTNGDFASGTGWTVNSGWAIGSGTLNATAVTVGTGKAVFAGATITAGRVYRITYTITSFTAGGISVTLGSGSYTDGTFRGAVGTYVEYITAGFSGGVEFIRRGGDFTGSIDNVEVVDVSAGSVTAPYGLQYDGVDDFLQTAAVDFTATDKMFVCAGVRKLSDAATALILELGANSSVASSSFGFQGPSVSGANKFNFNTSGTIVVVPAATTTTYNAPYLGVLTGVGNIAGDSAILRINGVEIQNLALDQGTGNYANAVLYFGRRGGTSIPYNGLDFGMVICGKTLTSTQVSQTERYIAQRTGISL